MGTRSPLRGLRCNVTKLVHPLILLKGFILFAWVDACGYGASPEILVPERAPAFQAGVRVACVGGGGGDCVLRGQASGILVD